MAVKLTDDQLLTVKSMGQYAENFADQMYHIMQNHDLDKVDGFRIRIDVFPASDLTTKKVSIGNYLDQDAGFVMLTKGKKDDRYAPNGTNSAEYEWLFADPALAERMRKIVGRENPLPPDGLWIGDSRNDPPVGNGEWDINDSLS